MSHTHGPLHVARFDQGDAALLSGDSKWICLVDVRDQEGYANADRLVRCWNTHDELLEALKVAANLLFLYLPDEQTVGTAFKSKDAMERIHRALTDATGVAA